MSQLSVVMLLGIATAAAVSAADRDWRTFAIVLSGAPVVLAGRWLNRRGATERAGLLVVWLLTIVATAAMALNQGPYSPAVLAYPAILVITAMTLGDASFLGLLAFMAASIVAMTMLSASGLHTFSYTRYGVTQMAYTLTTLGAVAAAVHLFAGDLRRAVARWRAEVSRVNASRERLAHLAQHDSLTGLPNRLAGQSAVTHALAAAGQQGRRAALMFVDIDNFKSVNDSLGLEAGDELLRQVGQRLKSAAENPENVMRHGGDVFLVVVNDAVDAARLTWSAESLMKAMSQPFELHGLTVVTSCSIGIAVYPDDGRDADVLLRCADIAVHHAKESGRNHYRFFDEGMNSGLLEDLSVNIGLRQALDQGEFRLYYQPVFELAGGRLLGAEALLRWHHPDKGVMSPQRFIAVAERSGLIVDIGQWVIDEACGQIAKWQDGPLRGLIVSVNTSGIQFRRGTLEKVIAEALDRHGTPPHLLEIEITESILIHDAEGLLTTLQRLKALGLRLAIDDFGTGYSNLSYLQRFAVDKLKIDQSFVRRLAGGGQDEAIVRAIIQMAASLNLKTTAEGIEDAQAMSRLVALGCDQGQGFHLGRPQPASAFEQFCTEHLTCR